MRLKVVEPRELLKFAVARNLIDGAHPPDVANEILPAVEVHSARASMQLPPMQVENRSAFVLRLPEATIAGSLGVIYEGFLLPGGVSHSMGWLDSHRRDSGWCELPQRERVDVAELGLCMLGPLSHWGHFFVDVLDRLSLLRQRGWLGRRLVADVGAPCVNAMALARRAGMAIEERVLFRASHLREYRVRDLLLPTLESSKPAISARTFRELRELVLPAAGGGDATLFVGRADVQYRYIVDQKSLIADLEQSGLGKAIFPEHLTIDDAIARFSAASAVILPVGSAKFNLIFCRPGTRLVCVTPEGYAEENTGVTGMIRHICHALDLKLSFYSCAIERHPQVLLHSNLIIGTSDLRRMVALIRG